MVGLSSVEVGAGVGERFGSVARAPVRTASVSERTLSVGGPLADARGTDAAAHPENGSLVLHYAFALDGLGDQPQQVVDAR